MNIIERRELKQLFETTFDCSLGDPATVEGCGFNRNHSSELHVEAGGLYILKVRFMCEPAASGSPRGHLIMRTLLLGGGTLLK